MNMLSLMYGTGIMITHTAAVCQEATAIYMEGHAFTSEARVQTLPRITADNWYTLQTTSCEMDSVSTGQLYGNKHMLWLNVV